MIPIDRYVKFDGLRMHWLEWGDPGAPPVVLQHGGRTSAHGTWDLTAPDLIRRYRLYAPDLRGHGESDWDPDARYTTGTYVADMERLIDHVGLERFDLIGHSLGGRIALFYAARHPQKVRRLVLVDHGPRLTSLPTEPLRMERPLSFASREEAEAFVRAENPDMSPTRSLSYGLVDLPDGRVRWRTDIEGLARARAKPNVDPLDNDAAWEAVRTVAVPTLVLRAGRSSVMTAQAAAKMTAINPHVRVVEYPTAGHWLHQDEPERFAREVLAFLDASQPREAAQHDN